MKIREGAGWGLGWGLGCGIERFNRPGYLWQWGDPGGYKNFVLRNPGTKSGVFVFTNGDAGMRLCDQVLNYATGLENPAFLWL